MRQNLQQLLDHGYCADAMGNDIDAQDLLIMVSALTGTVDAGSRQSRFVDILLTGLTPK
jgi:hypothetical protein